LFLSLLQILPEESVRSALLSLVKSGVIVLNNGFEEGAPRDLITVHSGLLLRCSW
jgi:hypothetical protein